MHKVLKFEDITAKWELVPRLRGYRILIAPNGSVIFRSGASVDKKDALNYLTLKASWVRKAIAAQIEQIPDRGPKAPRIYRASEKFHYLGKQLELKFLRSEERRVHAWHSGHFLFVEIPAKDWDARMTYHPFNEYEDAVIGFYKSEAEQFLPPRALSYAHQIGELPRRIIIRGQSTRWGSCSSNRTLSLNWKLMAAPLAVVDYVIIHEICHLRHMNHSKQFWDLVNSLFPDYRGARRWLKEHHHDFDFLNKLSNLYVSKLS